MKEHNLLCRQCLDNLTLDVYLDERQHRRLPLQFVNWMIIRKWRSGLSYATYLVDFLKKSCFPRLPFSTNSVSREINLASIFQTKSVVSNLTANV
jgi:hypothetical protein